MSEGYHVKIRPFTPGFRDEQVMAERRDTEGFRKEHWRHFLGLQKRGTEGAAELRPLRKQLERRVRITGLPAPGFTPFVFLPWLA